MSFTSRVQKYGKRPYLMLGLVICLLYFFLFRRSLVIYSLLLLSSAAIQYYSYKRFPKYNFGHIFFIAYLIDIHDGLAGEIFFIILAGFIPEFMAGNMDLKTVLSYPLMAIIISYFAPITAPMVGVAPSGIITGGTYFFILFFLGKYLGESPIDQLFEVILPTIVSSILFFNLADPLLSLLDILL